MTIDRLKKLIKNVALHLAMATPPDPSPTADNFLDMAYDHKDMHHKLMNDHTKGGDRDAALIESYRYDAIARLIDDMEDAL